jgi:DNA-binding MarR family transcriptional regulator
MIIDRVSFALAHAGKAAETEIRQALAGHGLKLSHAHVLGALAAHGRTGQQALTEALRVDPSVVVTLLNALEDDGLVARHRDPADRRRHLVEITPRGSDLVVKVDRAVQAVEAGLFAGLDEVDVAALRRILGRLEVRSGEACRE